MSRTVNLEDYEYGGRDGKVYTGAAAFVLNHLDSVEAALAEDLDVTEDNLKLYRLVDELLSMPAQLAAQINPEGGY